MKSVIKKRKRFIVNILGHSEALQVVIVSDNIEGMYRELYRLYGQILIDSQGKNTGTISYQETELT
ncbi:hypothetical protein JOC77_001612 [Peribacillus deserti]|uniref:Uncharacterized protein n=1 Tax=Peribacillus deserti TaxID=673318 RepID=A0ABS2QGU7_9BACI|nr:hypothetical protein [Peribacillus deserti]MBM7692185.1 hypothetical protein [Peribacillus deserti]